MEKVWKKTMTAVLTASLVAVSLAGCASGAKTNPPSKDAGTPGSQAETQAASSGSATALGFAWWGNQPRNEATQKAIDLFNQQNPDLKVGTQFFLWDDYWNKMATSAAGKSLPDIIQMDYSYISQYAGKEQLLDLTPYIKDGSLDTTNISENVIGMGKVGDGIYGIASGVNAPALFYNKTVTDKAGVTMKDNMTLEEFIAVAKQVKEKTGYYANFVDNYSLYNDQFCRARGIQIVGQALGGKSADDYLPYFQLEKQAIDDGWQLPPDIASAGTGIEQDPMVYGASPETMSWCKINGSNLLAAYQKAAPEGTEISLTTVPSEDSKKSNYLKPSMLFSISAKTQHPKEAVKLLNYLINSSDFYNIMLSDRGIPANTKIADEISPKLGKEDQAVTNYINKVVTPNCTPIAPPNQEGYNEQADLLRKIDQKVQYGEMTPEDAAKEYFTKGNEIFTEAAKKAQSSK